MKRLIKMECILSSFPFFVAEVIFYLICLIFSIPLFEYLISDNLALQDIFSCGGYSAKTLYTWIVFIQISYFVASILFGCADYYYDKSNVLHLKRIFNPGYRPLTTIPWNHVIKACHLAIRSSLISVFLLLFPFTPLIKLRHSCVSLSNYSLMDVCMLLFVKFPVVYVLVDCIFYGGHRLCHIIPYLYQNFHKLHHEWKHTFGVQAIACHPLEHIGVNLLSVFGAPLIAGLPVELQYLFVAIASITTVFAHCGYDTCIPWLVSGIPHDYHHHYWNAEFGTAGGLVDKIFQTRFQDIYPQTFDKLPNKNVV